MVGKIKLQDAVDDYDWIKCVRCQKLFPKRDYIIHRQEHKKQVSNNNGKIILGGDSGKRVEDKGKRIVEEENVKINNENLVRPSGGVTRRPGINLAGNRPNIIIKREIPVVTLSSDDDENAEINDENLPSDIHIGAATTATSATSDSAGSAVQNNRSSELTGSVNTASIPVSVIVERFSEIGGQLKLPAQAGDEPAKIVQNAKSSCASLPEREVPNVEVSNGKPTSSVSKLHKRLQRPGPLSWKKSLERKVSKEKSPPISSALDQLVTCQTCKEVFHTEEDLSSHKTKCRCEPESQESKSENSAFIINNQNASELRASCVTQIEGKGQDDAERLVVVLRRMSEDDPVTGEKGEYQCVDRNNSDQSVAMPSKKPRKRRSIESRIQLMKDIQPYVRRAAASKPIRYEENVCPYCDKAFSNYNMVEIHIRKKHEARGFESFNSSAVSQKVIGTLRPTIPTNSALPTYQTALVVQPNLPQVKPSRGKEKCEHCGRLFTAKQMIRHALFHAKKKPYKCTNCQKCFVSIAGKRGHQNKCRQYSLAFLPNGEWKRVPFKVSRHGTSSVNYAPSEPGKFNSIAVNMAIKTRGRRRKSRIQHAAARRSSPLIDGMRETLVEAGAQRDRKTEEKDSNIEQATKEKIQSPIRHKSEASNKPVPIPTKLAESDLKADYTSGVGKRIQELLKQLDKAAAATTRDNNVTMHRRKSETAGTPICWIVKEGQKSITCSLFTKKTTEGTTGKYSCQGRSLSSSSISDPDPLDCDFCSLKLAPAEYLHHVLQHEDCSAYTCPVCLKIYLHSGLYKRHMRLMHGQSGNTKNTESNNHSNNNVTLENQSSSSIQLHPTGIPHKVSLRSSPQRNMLKRQ